ncbi:MAG: hypothetical protein JWN17_2908 [Frankiales bacterium]|nr:hypothetical protein [Frankiales bacterium]
MTTRSLRACAALLCAGAVVLPLAGPASAAPEGSYWYTALHMDDNHRIATGKGAVIGLIDGPVDPTAAELVGQHVVAGASYCDGLKSPLTPGRDTFHATSMAALLVGSGHGTLPDGSGIHGVAPDATLRVYAIDDGKRPDFFECHQSYGAVGATQQSQLAGLAVRQAVDDGVDVLSMSLTMGGSDIVTAVDYALDHGVVVVGAVGGPDSLGNPAGIGGVIAVTACDAEGAPWPDAADGAVSVAAPGVDVSSGSVDRAGHWSSRGTGTGTSPATAIVAGMVAVLHSRYPHATSAQLVQHVLRTTTTPGLHFSPVNGWGNASLTRMLASDPGQWPDHLPFRGISADLLEPAQRLQDLAGTLDPEESYEYLLAHQPGFRPGSGPHTPTAAPPATASPAVAAPKPARGRDGTSPVLLVVGAGLLALVVAAAAVLLRSRARTVSSAPAPSGSGALTSTPSTPSEGP